MNNGQLKQRLRDISARQDLENHLQGFINQTTDKLNHRFCRDYSDFSADTDSNAILSTNPNLYIWGAMVELSVFVRDWEDHAQFQQKYLDEVRNMNINSDPTEWPLESLVIKSEQEQLYGD